MHSFNRPLVFVDDIAGLLLYDFGRLTIGRREIQLQIVFQFKQIFPLDAQRVD